MPYFPAIGATVGACRAYFMIGDDGHASQFTDFNLTFGNDPTGIYDITAGSTNALTYDLQGRIATPNRKGIFIQNGRKVVIK